MPSEEFALYVDTIKSQIDELRAAAASGAACDSDNIYAEAQNLLKDAGMEARMESDASQKKALLAEVDELKKSLASAMQALNSAKLKSGASVMGSKSEADRARVETATEKIVRQNDTIQNITRMVNETEDVGNDIVGELAQNREKIAGAREKTAELNSLTDDASIRVNRMQRKEKCVIS